MIAIGLDPSVTGFGWAVLNGQRFVRCGVWRTAKGDQGGTVAADNEKRFGFLARNLVELIDDQKEAWDSNEGQIVLFVEGLGTFKDRFTTAIAQGRARGLVDGIAAALNLQLVEVPPHDVKRIVPTLKRRKVEKSEVRDRVIELYPDSGPHLPPVDWSLNASDAIAIAHQGAARLSFRASLSESGGAW